MRNLILTFSVLLILVATGCATKTMDPALTNSITNKGGFTVTGGMVLSETANSCAVYTVRDTVRSKTIQLYCFNDDSLNSYYNQQVEGYTITTTVTAASGDYAGYFSCSYDIVRN